MRAELPQLKELDIEKGIEEGKTKELVELVKDGLL